MTFKDILKSLTNPDKSLIEILDEHIKTDKGYWGIRTLTEDEEYKVGDIARVSYDWDYENDCSTYFTTKEDLGGTCAIALPDTDNASIAVALCKAGAYEGNTMVLLHSKEAKEGYDPSEWIMTDAEVMYVWDRDEQ